MFAVIASTALLASTAIAGSIGSAVVVNKCTYPVTLCNVPAADGGFSEIDETLQPDDTYTQQWTELTNGNGWSIKLSKDTTLTDILQYEYTFHNDGIIWYDLSEVNGNPWDGNWEITADSGSGGVCSPKQQAYRYATDDAYGMQSCDEDATITVTLCSGESQNDGGAASASSVASEESATATSTFVAPTTASAPAYTSAQQTTVVSTQVVSPVSSASPTTFATSVVTTAAEGGSTVTEVATAVVTSIRTATRWHHGPHSRRHHY